VDVLVPSIEALLFMLRRDEYERWNGRVLAHLSQAYLRTLADELLDMGAAIVGLKLGEYGMYLRVTPNTAQLQRLDRLPLDVALWRGFTGYQPAYRAALVGATGAGDCAYAALIGAMLRGLPPLECLRMAAAVGACNVEAVDAISGVLTFEDTQARLREGWGTHPALA